jgi:hypothetical protein
MCILLQAVLGFKYDYKQMYNSPVCLNGIHSFFIHKVKTLPMPQKHNMCACKRAHVWGWANSFIHS